MPLWLLLFGCTRSKNGRTLEQFVDTLHAGFINACLVTVVMMMMINGHVPHSISFGLRCNHISTNTHTHTHTTEWTKGCHMLLYTRNKGPLVHGIETYSYYGPFSLGNDVACFFFFILNFYFFIFFFTPVRVVHILLILLLRLV